MINYVQHFFLQRNYANIINLTTERSALANRILELALNRTGKSVPKTATKNQVDLLSAQPTQSPAVVVKHIAETRDNINLMSGVLKQNMDEKSSQKLSPSDLDRTRQMLQKDISSYNSDIKLLSLLVGKPITDQDISKLAATNLGLSIRGNSIRSVATARPPTTSTTTTTTTLRSTPKTSQSILLTSTIPAFKPLSDREAQFLQALEQIQTTSTTTTTTERPRTVSKSQEAIIAALLKQQGFGPSNQIPIEVRI